MFEALFGGSPERQGTLAALAQIAQASGPQRMPQSLYSILGGGLMAGQQATQQAREQQQINELRGYAIRDKKSDYEAQEAQRARAKSLLDVQAAYQKLRSQPQSAPPVDRSASAIMQGLMGGSMPQMEAPGAPMAGGMAGGGQGMGGGNNRSRLVQDRLDYAQFLRDKGYGPEAQAEEDSAMKLQPKVSRWEKVLVGGKALYAPFFEDGSNGQPVPLEVAEKLDAINRGGQTDLVNQYTGATVRTLQNSMTPDGAASNALGWANHKVSRQRLEVERAEAATRAAAGKAPTEFQGKSAAFGLRATEADKIISELTGQYNPAAVNAKTSVENWPLIGGALGAATNSLALNANDQKAEQAQRDFVNAVLRQESGAAIGADEFNNARKQYFPQPGDGPDVIAQKARNRQLAIQGFQSNAGRAAMTAPPRATTSGGWSIQRVD